MSILAPRLGAAIASLVLALPGPGCQRATACDGAPEPAATPENAPKAVDGTPPWRPGYVRPPVIDVHTHIMPSGLSRLQRIMAENQLTAVVNLSGGSPGRGAEVSHAITQRFPSIFFFYNPDWRRLRGPDFATAEAARLELAVRTMGFKGLKISKALGLHVRDPEGARVPVDWPGLDPLWAKAGELGIPVAIHTSDPKAFWEPPDATNERYEELSLHPSWSYYGTEHPSREQLLAERDRLLARHRNTTFICVHFANNPEDLAYVDTLLDTHPNAMLDTSARLGEIGRHPPEVVRAFFIKHKRRILFGTDLGLASKGIMLGSSGAVPPTMDDVKPFYEAHWRFFEGKERGIPHPTPVQGAWTIDAIDLPDHVLDAIYVDNARRVLGLDPPAAATPPSGQDHGADAGVGE